MANHEALIYTLADPRKPERIRYVGLALRAARPYEHGKIARQRKKKTHLYDWIRSIQADGFEPLVSIVEYCTVDTVSDRERQYIEQMLADGHQLTNMTEGGITCVTALTPEARAAINVKISVGLTGCKRSAETRAKMSAAKKGQLPWNRIDDPNHIKPSKLKRITQRRAEATHRRITPTEETKEKMRQAMKRYYEKEGTREAARQRSLQQHGKSK